MSNEKALQNLTQNNFPKYCFWRQEEEKCLQLVRDENGNPVNSTKDITDHFKHLMNKRHFTHPKKQGLGGSF